MLLLAAAAAWAQDPGPPPPLVREASEGPFAGRLELVPASPGMGGPVHLTLRATVGDETAGALAAGRVEWPDLTDLLTEAFGEEVVEFDPGDGVVSARRRDVTFRIFDAGTFEIPALPLVFHADEEGRDPLRVELPAVTVEIGTVLPDDAAPLPTRGAVEWAPPEESSALPWALLAGAFVGAGLLVWWLRRRRAEESVAAAPPPPPPHERALAALDALVARKLPETGAVEPYFVELSEILRHYLEDRFGLHAPERTTEEFLAEITSTTEGRRAIREGHRTVLREFLSRADLVKFARAAPDVEACGEAAGTARRFVEDTVPAPAPEAPA